MVEGRGMGGRWRGAGHVLFAGLGRIDMAVRDGGRGGEGASLRRGGGAEVPAHCWRCRPRLGDGHGRRQHRGASGPGVMSHMPRNPRRGTPRGKPGQARERLREELGCRHGGGEGGRWRGSLVEEESGLEGEGDA